MSLAALVLIGGLIYGPVMLIGLQALDLSPREVAGTAAGFTGLFGYVLGATLASTGIGASVHAFGWDVTFVLILVCVALAIVLLAIVGRDESALRRRREERGDVAARGSRRGRPDQLAPGTTMPRSYAKTTACTRSRTPSFSSRRETCVFTVASPR